MKITLQLISFLALLAVLLPPILYLTGACTKPLMSSIMLAGTFAWFASAPFWMGRKQNG